MYMLFAKSAPMLTSGTVQRGESQNKCNTWPIKKQKRTQNIPQVPILALAKRTYQILLQIVKYVMQQNYVWTRALNRQIKGCSVGLATAGLMDSVNLVGAISEIRLLNTIEVFSLNRAR